MSPAGRAAPGTHADPTGDMTQALTDGGPGPGCVSNAPAGPGPRARQALAAYAVTEASFSSVTRLSRRLTSSVPTWA